MKAPTRLLLLAAALLFCSPAQGQIGFAAGLNFTSVSDLDGSSVQNTYDNASGYHIGVFFDLGAGPAALRIGAFYRELGSFDVSYGALRQTVDVTALDFPVDLRINVLATPVISPYVLAGPVFTVPRSSDESSNNSLEDFAVSGNVGFGIQFKAGGLKLLPEFRYVVGVTSIVKDGFTLAGQNIGAEAKDQRSNSAMLRLGIAF
jgi:hypothetical protein